ncbi:MAG: hypothetical protein GF308_18095 [Candidatus Heimdallarchaeota archaeon]|nr:hypothetical protein [Candidatus Heimdallarchaeota archaeon]
MEKGIYRKNTLVRLSYYYFTALFLYLLLFTTQPLFPFIGASQKKNGIISSLKAEAKESISPQDILVDWQDGASFFCPQIYEQGTIQISFTVLPFSNASVFFSCSGVGPHYHWSPSIPSNFSLAIGESFEGTFTLESSSMDGTAALQFSGKSLTENRNATVRWWYKVLRSGWWHYRPHYYLLLAIVVGTIIVCVPTVLLLRFFGGIGKRS